jgi:hypothetical protein
MPSCNKVQPHDFCNNFPCAIRLQNNRIYVYWCCCSVDFLIKRVKIQGFGTRLGMDLSWLSRLAAEWFTSARNPLGSSSGKDQGK